MERRVIDLRSGSRSDQASPLMTTAAWSLRIALATAFLSAVADRFGLWGPPGAENVAWGAWPSFVDYTGVLLPFLPKGLVSLSAILATAAEIVLGLWLLVPWKPRPAAFASAALLLMFALSMVLAIGVKAPLNYSVFTAAAAAFLLGVITPAR